MHHGHLGFLRDGGSHAFQLLHVHESILENLFGDHGCSTGLGHQGHELGLQVGREAGVRSGVYIDSGPFIAVFDPHPVFTGFKIEATFTHFHDQRLDIAWNTLLNPDIATSDCPGNQQGSRLNPVRYDKVFARMKFIDTLDTYHAAAITFDPGAHFP